MKPNQNTWINTTLKSLDGVQRAEPSPFLYAKIRDRLTVNKSLVYVPARTVWLVIASFGLLVLLNWQSVRQLSQSSENEMDALTTVVQGLQLYSDSNQLYPLWNGPNY